MTSLKLIVLLSMATEQNIRPRIWINIPQPEHYLRPHEIQEFSEEYGVVNPPPRGCSPIVYFDKLITNEDGDNMIDILVLETNRYAEQCLQTAQLKPHSRANEWKPTCASEMSAFLGMYLAMGILKKPSIESYWNDNNRSWLFHTPNFQHIMTRNRFQLLLQFLHCNNNETALPRGTRGHDPVHKIRPILNLVNETFRESYALARDVTVDESMVGFKGRNNLIQYCPGKKTHRWGVKLFVLAESETGYTAHIKVYAGKAQTGEPLYPHGLGYDVVTDLVRPLYGKFHHVIVDNYFSSPTLCDHLYYHDTYMTSTVKDTRKGMPKSFKALKVQRNAMAVKQSGAIMAVKYGDKKNVTFLSSFGTPIMERIANARGVDREIPNGNHIYNKTMGGVDLSDALVQTYDPDIKSLKMWKKILFNMLLRVVVNAYIVYKQNRTFLPKMSHLEFAISLCQDLIGQENVQGRQHGVRPSTERLCGRHFAGYIPIHSQHHVNDNRPDFMLATVEAWRRENIYVTKSVQAVKDKALSKDCVCVIGVPGAGKSTALHHAALSLETEGFIIYFISDPTEFLKYYDERKKQVFVVDDAMGVYLTSSCMVGLWQEHYDRVKNALGANTKLLVSIRTQIFKSEIKREKIVFLDTQTADHVDFSDAGQRIGLDDMRGMLKHYMTIKGFSVQNINEVIIDVWPKNETELKKMKKKHKKRDISRYTVGLEFAECFPLLCKVFVNIEFARFKPEAFFKNPYPALTKIFQNIKLENKHQFCSLVLCTMFDGKLASDMISPFSESPFCEAKREIGKDKIALRNRIMSMYKLKCPEDLDDLQLAFQSLTGVYISLVDATYKMSHAVFSDIVVYVLDDPLLVFEYGTSEFIRDRVRISATSSDDPYLLQYSDDRNIERLADRLVKDLKIDPATKVKFVVDNPNINDERLITCLDNAFSNGLLDCILVHELFRQCMSTVWHNKDIYRCEGVHHYKLIELCVRFGADCNMFIGDDLSGVYPIHISTSVDSLKLTKLLLLNGADKRRVDFLGYSVLFCVLTYTKCNKLELMKLLIEHGVDSSVIDVTRGRDLIQYQLRRYRSNTLRLEEVLPDSSIKVLTTDKNKITHYVNFHKGVLQLVCHIHDNMLTYIDPEGRNILHQSADNFKVTSYLLSLPGITQVINQRDCRDRTPYWYVENKQHPDQSSTVKINAKDRQGMIKIYKDNHATL